MLVYLDYFGWSFLLWFCCMANVYAFVGCLTGGTLWFSLAAVTALGVHVVYALDFAAALAQLPSLGATDYMFDPTRPLLVRGLSLFHLWMPCLLGYAILKLGYDRRAFAIQTTVAWCVLPVCYLAFDPSLDTNDAIFPLVHGHPFDRDFNINWVHAFYDRPDAHADTGRLWSVMFGYPLLFQLPVHRALLALTHRPGAVATAAALPGHAEVR
ncbi:MAG: hypothetical protein OEZ06_28270 [Myxococcales bacterium]|nr:hypothetical protein [Myxococcales bacterium]